MKQAFVNIERQVSASSDSQNSESESNSEIVEREDFVVYWQAEVIGTEQVEQFELLAPEIQNYLGKLHSLESIELVSPD